jgi:hypothetical protein
MLNDFVLCVIRLNVNMLRNLKLKGIMLRNLMLSTIVLSVFMLSVVMQCTNSCIVMLSVIMLNVVAPLFVIKMQKVKWLFCLPFLNRPRRKITDLSYSATT